MNNERRKVLNALRVQLEDITYALLEVRCDEAIAFENLPDSISDGPQGNKHQESLDCLDTAIDCIDTAISDLEDAIQ